MYINRLYLKDIRCFGQLEIIFGNREDSGQVNSILLLGENGDGKSTILKSLAMGLCDESSAAALFRELPGEYVRRQPSQEEVPTGRSGYIEIDLIDNRGRKYRIKTSIISLEKFERVKQNVFVYNRNKWDKLGQDDFPWEDIFVSAYGPGVRTNATSDFQHYLPVDAVYPLFNYSSPLQNPELVIHRLMLAARNSVDAPDEKNDKERVALGQIQKLMAELLDLRGPECFSFSPTGIKVEGHWGVAELSELSDGYQALINWVIDLISWWLLHNDETDQLTLESISGIVVIDEIEQHLHPRWQRGIFPRLRAKFPGIQFIVATHSPLVSSANPDIDVHLLNNKEHRVVQPFGWLAEDVYSLMGVAQTRPEKFRKELDRYGLLNKMKIEGTAGLDELNELESLRGVIASLPESDPVSLTTEIDTITDWLKNESGNIHK